MNRRTQQEMEEIEEQEDDYVNASRGAVDAKRTRPGLRFVLLIAVCWWIILLAIMGLRIYLTSELSGNNAKLYSRIQELDSRFQELETRENNLKQQIQNMTTNRNELNITRAQWSIDSYCLGNTDKKCKPCQRGWLLTEPSCYQYIDAQPPNRKTWEEAQEDCSGKNSDLAVAHDSEEKEAINTNSFGFIGFWIGLRVEDGEWKWVDGSDLTESSWIAAPVDGRCALLFKGRDTWSSVSCDRKHQWICQKKALTV